MEENIKRERIKGKYYWIKREKGQIKEQVPYKRADSKEDILRHLKKYKTIDTNLLSKKILPNVIQTVTVQPPKNTKNTQSYLKMEAYVNGKKLEGFYYGIGRKGENTGDSYKSALRHGTGYNRKVLIDKGIITYEDNIVFKPITETFINWIPKRR